MGKFISDTIKYSYNDISIVPAVISDIEHRAECNPYDDKGMLPLFTAPMDSVVNLENFKTSNVEDVSGIFASCRTRDNANTSEN